MRELRKLIAVVTCHKYADRAAAARATWASRVQGAAVKYFRGCPDQEQEYTEDGNDVYLKVPDDYAHLPAKVRAMFRWAVANDYDYICKVDDDVYILPDVLLAMPIGGYDYIGRFRGPAGGYPADYASGFAYWLSVKAATIVSNAELNADWAEDRWVGNVLLLAGIQGHTCGNLFAPVVPPLLPDLIVRTNVRFSAVFCEFSNIELLKRMHILYREMIINTDPGMRHPLPVKQNAISPEDLLREPNDREQWWKRLPQHA